MKVKEGQGLMGDFQGLNNVAAAKAAKFTPSLAFTTTHTQIIMLTRPRHNNYVFITQLRYARVFSSISHSQLLLLRLRIRGQDLLFFSTVSSTPPHIKSDFLHVVSINRQTYPPALGVIFVKSSSKNPLENLQLQDELQPFGFLIGFNQNFPLSFNEGLRNVSSLF